MPTKAILAALAAVLVAAASPVAQQPKVTGSMYDGNNAEPPKLMQQLGQQPGAGDNGERAGQDEHGGSGAAHGGAG